MSMEVSCPRNKTLGDSFRTCMPSTIPFSEIRGQKQTANLEEPRLWREDVMSSEDSDS